MSKESSNAEQLEQARKFLVQHLKQHPNRPKSEGDNELLVVCLAAQVVGEETFFERPAHRKLADRVVKCIPELRQSFLMNLLNRVVSMNAAMVRQFH